jgi:hypothetical protein
MSKMYAIKNMDALRDEIGYAVVCAPDSWMYKEWRSPSEQDSLESVFQTMRDAIAIIDPKIATPTVLPRIKSLLEESYQAYLSGDGLRGAHLLNDWSALIFGPEPGEEPNA